MTRVERIARLLGLAVGVVRAASAPPRATAECVERTGFADRQESQDRACARKDWLRALATAAEHRMDIARSRAPHQAEDVAGRIKAWRLSFGLTQEQFAALASMPKRTLVGYENNEREPGAASLAALARTGVNLNWLLTGAGEMRVRHPDGVVE